MDIVYSARGRIIGLECERRPNGAIWERAVRPPGVRALITDGESILLCREWREELGGWDLRLPGGKVWDSFLDFQAVAGDAQGVLTAARHAVAKEILEETGMRLSSGRFDLLGISPCGATIKWDLYVFHALVSKFELNGRASAIASAEGERTEPLALSASEALRAAIDGRMSEDRAAIWVIRHCMGRLNGQPWSVGQDGDTTTTSKES